MKLLKITQIGLFIDLPGIPNFRTPAIVDVTKIDNEILKLELRKHGIHHFEIIEGNKKEKHIVKKEKIIKVENSVKQDIVNILNIDTLDKIAEDQKLHANTMIRIEKLLERFLEKKLTSNMDFESPLKKNKFIEEDNDEFIPSINIDGIQTKGNFASDTITEKTNVGNAEKLNKSKYLKKS